MNGLPQQLENCFRAYTPTKAIQLWAYEETTTILQSSIFDVWGEVNEVRIIETSALWIPALVGNILPEFVRLARG